ncbi:pentatricopeptide repeat-containing protein At2g27610 [Prosopis cineraria]|uniref:pentatricopeptide repeat-containing protein At2g27610 n=1 Tax=Prosopis cineraria TaxID=364024 RepID=UPI00240EE5F1|nr:pentatricopeptide repeat-containing protein At2g27610 [Prosopis cineraria]
MTSYPSLRLLTNTLPNPILRSGRSIQYHTGPLFQSNAVAVDPRFSGSVEHDPSEAAHQLFDQMPLRGLKEYNRLLFYYSQSDQTREALHLFVRLCRSGLPIEGPILSSVLKACASSLDGMVGRQVHCQCMKSGFLQNVSVGTALVDMYMKNVCVRDGRRVFDEMEERNVVSWTSLLSGYSWNGYDDHALELFCQMRVEGYMPNHYTVSTIIGALANHGAVEVGIQIHAMVIKHGFETMTPVCNSLINMYSKSGMLRDAGAIFYSMESKDSVSWNSMISGEVTNGQDLQALEMFYHMQIAGVKPTQSTFGSIIKSCANLKELDFVRLLHCRTLKSGYSNDQGTITALMNAYLKCKETDYAYHLLSLMSGGQNVVSWTAMINGYLQNGNTEHAVNLFSQMRREGVKPNHFTYSTILKVQNAVSIFQIHAVVIKANYEKSSSVGTALLDAYVKIGYINDAVKVFEVIEAKDIIAWSAMIAGFAQTGETEEAVKIFLQLSREGIKPNEFTFSSIINACSSSTASAEQGKQFHAFAIKMRLNNALCVSSSLVTMYSKRGNIESAHEVFKRQGERDLVSWNSMISGYAQHGHANKAVEVFEKMQNQNMKVDAITFIGVISACTHAGLVDEGQRYFNMMVNDHHIGPTMEHYSCMIDLYSRAGLLGKAMDIINGMPFPPCTTVWRTLLAACRVHRNMDLGKLAAEKLILLQPQHSAAYVLLSNMYAAAGKWQERANVRKLMEKRRVKKEAGYSWIEVKNKTYSFLAGDLSHPMSDQIYSKLAELNIRLKDAGYQPDTNYVFHDVEDEHKEAILSQHSERLAIAFGLIATVPEVPIQIVKNLRVCGDCHNFIKLISLVEQRYIVVRDSNRFHHFKGGLCSCGDYW